MAYVRPVIDCVGFTRAKQIFDGRKAEYRFMTQDRGLVCLCATSIHPAVRLAKILPPWPIRGLRRRLSPLAEIRRAERTTTRYLHPQIRVRQLNDRHAGREGGDVWGQEGKEGATAGCEIQQFLSFNAALYFTKSHERQRAVSAHYFFVSCSRRLIRRIIGRCENK